MFHLHHVEHAYACCMPTKTTNGTLGMDYSLNSTRSVKFDFPLGALTIGIESDSVLYGVFSLIEATNIQPNYVLLEKYKDRFPLSPIFFFSLNLTSVFIPANLTENEFFFETSLLVNWKSLIPTTFNLNPNSYQILKYSEISNIFRKFSDYSPKDYGTTITIEQAFNKVVTFGIFVFKSEEKVSLGDYVSINYPRSIYNEEKIFKSVSQLSYTFPQAAYQPNSMSDQTIKVSWKFIRKVYSSNQLCALSNIFL